MEGGVFITTRDRERIRGGDDIVEPRVFMRGAADLFFLPSNSGGAGHE